MATAKQILGELGELFVTKSCRCPKCNYQGPLLRLRNNFKCADLKCASCGLMAQVKTKMVANVDLLPRKIMGAAWGPQAALLEAGSLLPLYIVLFEAIQKKFAIYFLSAELQSRELFEPRKPLSKMARRAGWQGFNYDLRKVDGRLVRLI